MASYSKLCRSMSKDRLETHARKFADGGLRNAGIFASKTKFLRKIVRYNPVTTEIRFSERIVRDGRGLNSLILLFLSFPRRCTLDWLNISTRVFRTERFYDRTVPRQARIGSLSPDNLTYPSKPLSFQAFFPRLLVRCTTRKVHVARREKLDGVGGRPPRILSHLNYSGGCRF